MFLSQQIRKRVHFRPMFPPSSLTIVINIYDNFKLKVQKVQERRSEEGMEVH